MSKSVPLKLYRAATRLLEPAANSLLRWRERRGKEDPARLRERLGYAGRPRPAGKLVWVHGASVGEGLAVLPLIERFVARGFKVVLTTGTVTSSRVLGERLPPQASHQFVPLDVPASVGRFYDHWRPDLVIFAESELWPNLLGEAQRRRVPAVLVNARMSARSCARWARMPVLIRSLLASFHLVLAQSDPDADRLRSLGAAEVRQVGNLKFDASPPPADAAEVRRLRTLIGTRPIWVAASTHAGEDELCCRAHARLAARWPGLLTVVVPRQPDRGPSIATCARSLGLEAGLRSHGATIEASTAVYVADTMGEIGLFYRLASIVFVGKSLVAGGGGQNPIEPAKLGCAVLHGPHVANFEDAYAALRSDGGGRLVANEAALADAVATLLSDPDKRSTMAASAAATVARLGGATERTMAAIEPLCAAILEPSRP